jgi:hypothetical protein
MKANKRVIKEAKEFFAVIPAETIAEDLRHITRHANKSETIRMVDKDRLSDLNFTQHQVGNFLKRLSVLVENA